MQSCFSKTLNYYSGSTLILVLTAGFSNAYAGGSRRAFVLKPVAYSLITAATIKTSATSTSAGATELKSSFLHNTKMNEQEKQDAKFWDNIAESYSKSPIQDQETYDEKLAITREYFGSSNHADKSSTKVFEFGCGTGSTALLHAPYVKSIYATDISSNMISIANAKAKEKNIHNIEFEATSIDRVAVPDESYDVVLGMNILHLVPHKDNCTLKKINNMLKPGGVFISDTFCASGILSGFFKTIGPLGSRRGFFPKNVNIFSSFELEEMLTNAGFEIEREYQPEKSKHSSKFIVARKKC